MKKAAGFALIKTIPVFLGYIFLGIAFGLLLQKAGLGAGWAFLISLIFTPLVGLIVALLTDPLPGGDRRWGCIGTLLAILGLAFLAAFLLLLLTGGALVLGAC